MSLEHGGWAADEGTFWGKPRLFANRVWRIYRRTSDERAAQPTTPVERAEMERGMNDSSIRFDLGGQGFGTDRTTVNLYGVADINRDILDLDGLCEDGTVDEFYLSHTLEHIPGELYVKFLHDLVRKLRPGGNVRVVQTDAEAVMRSYMRGELCFRSMRSVIFTPPDRLVGDRPDANPLQCHRNMWSAKELARDLEAVGLQTSIMNAPTWPFDMGDPFYPDELKLDWGKPIAQLDVVGVKP